MKSDVRREFLQNSPLFAGLEPAILDRVLAVAVTKRLARGETLFQKGDPGDRLFGVLLGRVKVHAASADAMAVAPCEFLVIHRRDFMPLVEAEGKLAMHIIRLLCQRVRNTSEMLEDAAFLPLEQRLAKHLLRLIGNYGQPVSGGIEIGLRLPQQELAHMMATTRESVNK